MKIKNQLFFLTALYGLLSCNSVQKKDLKKDSVSKAKTASLKQNKKEVTIDSSNSKKNNSALSKINYFFSTDSLCQILSIRKLSDDKNKEMPGKLEFSLTFHDKLQKIEDKKFNAIAVLASPEESFSDYLDKDGGDYTAADYEYKTPEYDIQIRLDIENYEACVVQITGTKGVSVLGGFITYVKKFPNYGIMKKGECK